MSKNLIIVILGLLVFLFILDETCIWDFIPDKCSKGVVLDEASLDSIASGLGYDICACDNRLRFQAGGTVEANGGSTISSDDAVKYMRNFRDKFKTPKFGAFISKKALDRIFCADPKANGVYCYTGLIENSEDPDLSETFIVLEGAARPDYEIETNTAGLVFKSSSRTLCPDQCGLTGQQAGNSDTAHIVTNPVGH